MTPEPTRKSWGISLTVHLDEFVQAEKIHVFAGGYSSVHRHEHKANRFLVYSGRLIVRTYRPDMNSSEPRASWRRYWAIDQEHNLRTGEELLVLPCVVHSFHAAEKTTALELYYLVPFAQGPIDPHDIERFSANGCDRLDTKDMARPDEKHALCGSCYKPEPINAMSYKPIDGADRPVCPACVREFQLGDINGGYG